MPDQDTDVAGVALDLGSFGEELRREREIRGISLKEISDATKISIRFLQAIEHNDHATLPAPVFTRGFVREYARYVGLNAEEMVDRYNLASAKDDRIEKPPEIQKYPNTPIRAIASKPPVKRDIPLIPRVDRSAIVSLVLVAAVAAIAWWAVRSKRIQLDSEIEPPPPAVTTRAAQTAVPPPLPPPAVEDQSLHLSVEAIADSWVTLEADGKTVLNAELARGERQTFEADDSFRFRVVGNAGGLSLTLNGTPVPPPGGDGQVIRDLVFNRAKLEQMRQQSKASTAPTQP